MINRVIRHPYAQPVITLSCCGKFNLSHCEPAVGRKVLEVGDRWTDDDNDDDDDDDDRDDEIFAGGKSIIYHSFEIAERIMHHVPRPSLLFHEISVS